MSTEASKEAYIAILDKLPKKRGIVFAEIESAGLHGMTIREARLKLNWEHTTVSARIHELADAGLICPRGDKRDGQTVWVVTASDKREFWKEERLRAKKYETGIKSFTGLGGPGAYGPDQIIQVTIEMPRKAWDRIKKPTRVRFL